MHSVTPVTLFLNVMCNIGKMNLMNRNSTGKVRVLLTLGKLPLISFQQIHIYRCLAFRGGAKYSTPVEE